jgi:glycosyltransferase involved in cell wall biosynthesis
MSELRVSATIPIVEKHARFAASLFENLALVDPGFDEIVVVCSGLKKSSLRQAVESAKAIKSEVVFIEVPLLPLGVNRNIGWMATTGNIVCFLDADDLYSSNYRQHVESAFELFNADLFLHGFVELQRREAMESKFPESPRQKTPTSFLFSSDLVRLNDLGAVRNRSAELRQDSSLSQVRLPRGWPHSVHQGHASVRRELLLDVPYIFERGQRNEDGIFIKDCLDRGKMVVISSEPLSAYSLHTSALYWTPERLRKLSRRLWSKSPSR